jgi:hypothetical protein
MKNKKPKKEALFVQVPSVEGSVEYHDVTGQLGKLMPFKNPKATCGMRVGSDVVAFSLLHMTKKTAAGMLSKELMIPRGPLARVERRALDLLGELEDDEVFLEMDSFTQKCKLVKDENNVAELEPIGEDVTFELPREAVKMSIYIKSKSLGRMIAIGFIGFPGKPGNVEKIRRIASMAMFSLTQLNQFRVVSGLVSMVIPSAPRHSSVFVRKTEDKVLMQTPVSLFTESDEPVLVATGNVMVEIDLDNANPSTNRLLYHFRPDAEILEHFESYRAILDATVTEVLREVFDESEISSLAVDIVLGELGDGGAKRLRDALVKLNGGLNLTTKMRQFR